MIINSLGYLFNALLNLVVGFLEAGSYISEFIANF